MSPAIYGHRGASESRFNLVAEIKRLHSKGEPLNISAVRNNHPILLLDVYRQKPFLGWKGALRLAGMDYGTIKMELPKHVVCKICGARRQRLKSHIRRDHQMSPETYLEMHKGAELVSDAFKAIKKPFKHILMPHWEPVWSPEYVLDRLHEFHRQGIPLHSSNIEQKDRSCYLWARRFFGNWNLVLQGLGLEPSQVRKAASKKLWTRDSLIREVRRLKAQGHALNVGAMLKLSRPVIYGAKKVFGSYDNMLKAAGLNPAAVRKQPPPKRPYKTGEDVISGIYRRKVMEKPLNTKAVAVGASRDLPLLNKARRVFGSWQKAIEAAGISYSRVCRYNNKYMSPELVLQAIRERQASGKLVTSIGVDKGPDKDRLLYDRAREYFENWKTAVEKAGLKYVSSHGRKRTQEPVSRIA